MQFSNIKGGIYERTANSDGNRTRQAAEPEYLTARQLAGKVNVSLKAVTKWTAARRLPCCKMGRVWRYPCGKLKSGLFGNLLYDKP